MGEGYVALPQKDKTEIITKSFSSIVSMKDVASGDELSAIENDIQQSAPAGDFRKAQGSSGRIATLGKMSQNDKMAVFEAMASSNNPQEIRTLRATITAMKPEEREEFVADVVTRGSKTSVQKYLQRVEEEKEDAQEAGMAGDVERLTKEETIITKTITAKNTQETAVPVAQTAAPTRSASPAALPRQKAQTSSTPSASAVSKQSAETARGIPQSATIPKIPVAEQKSTNGTKTIDTVVTTGKSAPQARISAETGAQATREAREARGELGYTDTEKTKEVLERTIEVGKLEKDIEKTVIQQQTSSAKPTDSIKPRPIISQPMGRAAPIVGGGPSKFVEGSTGIAADVGAKPEEEKAQNKDESLERELQEIRQLEATINASMEISIINTALQRIKGKILTLESYRRSLEETGTGTPAKIQTLTNIVSAYRVLQIKAEEKIRRLGK